MISCGAEVIARHPRSYEKDDFIFDPIHYLPLLEQKTGARWTRPRPCRGGTCPRSSLPCAGCWRPGMGRRGKREFVQVLRLMEKLLNG